MTKKLKLVFSNDSSLIINLNDSITATKLADMSKHLQRVPLRFCNYDSPFSHTSEIIIKQLLENANLLNIDIDQNQLDNQLYLNALHQIYERGYNGDKIWLEFHESIHMIEAVNSGKIPAICHLDYREISGLLAKKYSYQELLTCQSTFVVGDCFVSFSELGKTPYTYWRDGEPNDINRLIELAKPMIRLNFKISIALADIAMTICQQDQLEFDNWFNLYKNDWCNHWSLPDWTISQIRGGIKIGKINEIDILIDNLKNNHRPAKLILIND
jgi:hypothetical protein